MRIDSNRPMDTAEVEPRKPAVSASKLSGAARQFEALLLTELLRASHTEESGWMGSEGDAASGQATAMAEEFLAQALSAKGGIGIARMVTDGLKTEAGGNTRPDPDRASSTSRL